MLRDCTQKQKAEAAKYVLDAVKIKNFNACIIHPSGIIGPNDFGNSHLTQLVKRSYEWQIICLRKRWI